MAFKKFQEIFFFALAAFGFLTVAFSSESLAAKFEDGVKATDASISLVDGVAADKKGNTYISRRDHNTIDRISPDGKIYRYAGNGSSGFSGDGGPAKQARLKLPAGLAFDDAGNLYIADRENHRVRKVDARGNITTVAGTGTAGFSGDGGPAIKAQLNLPAGVAVDKKGNLYIADRSNDRIRKVNSKGVISTVAGSGVDGFFGDAGPALKANLSKPFGVAVDNKGAIYIADRGNNRIRRVDAHGIISTVAGDGAFFFIGDNGPAYRASIAGPTGVAVDSEGSIYVADRNNNRIRKVNSMGMIRTIAGTGQQEYNGDAEVARETNLYLPFGVALDPEGKLLVIDRSHYRIRRVDPNTGQVVTVAGNGEKRFYGDGGPATGAQLNFPHGIFVDKNDEVIFADKSNSLIRKIKKDGTIESIAGNGKRGTLGNGGPVLKASIMGPTTLVPNSKGEMFFLSPSGYVSIIRKIDSNGIIDHFLGTSDPHYVKAVEEHRHMGQAAQDNRSMVTQFSDLAFDKQDNLYASDRINNQIRKVDPQGNVSTIGGTGDADYTGDGGPAVDASFNDPLALVVDDDGNLFVADAGNNVIRKIDAKGIVTTYAGNGTIKDSGDGGPAMKAGIRYMDDLKFSPSGELHIVESNSHIIRKITKEGIIETVAGRKGVQGLFGDGGPATKAMLKTPSAIAFDSKGNMYISDMGNSVIRKVGVDGAIAAIAGSGTLSWGNEGEEVVIYFQDFP